MIITKSRKPPRTGTATSSRRVALDFWTREDGGIGVRVLPTGVRRGELVILDPDDGPLTLEEALEDSTATEIVAAPWDPAEDAERLRPAIERLLAEIETRRNLH